MESSVEEMSEYENEVASRITEKTIQHVNLIDEMREEITELKNENSRLVDWKRSIEDSVEDKTEYALALINRDLRDEIHRWSDSWSRAHNDNGHAHAEKYKAALNRIAAWDDKGASEKLAWTGSYSSFDEPGSVEIARKALKEAES